MKRIEILQNDSRFCELLAQVERAESERIFCQHDLSHLLDTARIAWITALENGISLSKACVYAAALLHDLGRAAEYAGCGNHDTAALDDCREILSRAGFTAAETEAILSAIASHGDKTTPDDTLPPLSALLRRADRLSRPCYACAAADKCYWDDRRRNHRITI